MEVTFHSVLPFFASSRRVIAVEEQGHGRTTDREAPVTFDQFQAGVKSPIVGLLEDGTGVGSLRWNVRTVDHVRPIRFSSSARTRQ